MATVDEGNPLSFLSGQTGDEQIDPAVARVLDLLQGLEMAPAPKAPNPLPHLGMGRILAGALGDALQNAGSIRSGHGPSGPGPFAQALRQRQLMAEKQQQDYLDQQQATEASNRALRNQIRVMAIQGRIAKQPQEKAANIQEFDREVGGENHRIRQILDPMTGRVTGEVDLGKQYQKPEAPEKPGKPQLTYDEQGNALWAYPPEAGGKTVPAGFKKPPSQAQAGMSEALTSSEYLLDKMQSHFDAAVKKHSASERAIMAGPASSKIPGISGMAGYADPDAAIHERNRHNVAVALAAPMTGSRRGQAAVIERIELGLPSYADNPVVADEFYKQMHALIANMRRAYPSGFPRGDAGDDLYLEELDSTIAKARDNAVKAAGGTPQPGPQPSGSISDSVVEEYKRRKAAGAAGPQ